MSLITPVEVSEKVVKTTSTSLSPSKRSSSAGSTFFPHSVSQCKVRPPYATQSSAHRSPNLPQEATSTRSSGRTRLATADSSAPVPDEAKTSTSFSVWKIVFSLARARA
jgi:hypothetical protein